MNVIELYSCDANGVPQYVLPDATSVQVSYALSDVSTLQFSYPSNGVNYSQLTNNSLVAVKIDGSFPSNHIFVVEQRQGAEVSDEFVFDQIVCRDLSAWLDHTIMYPDTVNVTGPNIVFYDYSIGQAFGTLFAESAARAVYGFDKLDVSTFSAGTDSNGRSWPLILSLTYNFGGTLLSVLQSMVQSGFVEFEWVGLSLRLYGSALAPVVNGTAPTTVKLHNFANATPPSSDISGQTWTTDYNTYVSSDHGSARSNQRVNAPDFTDPATGNWTATFQAETTYSGLDLSDGNGNLVESIDLDALIELELGNGYYTSRGYAYTGSIVGVNYQLTLTDGTGNTALFQAAPDISTVTVFPSGFQTVNLTGSGSSPFDATNIAYATLIISVVATYWYLEGLTVTCRINNMRRDDTGAVFEGYNAPPPTWTSDTTYWTYGFASSKQVSTTQTGPQGSGTEVTDNQTYDLIANASPTWDISNTDAIYFHYLIKLNDYYNGTGFSAFTGSLGVLLATITLTDTTNATAQAFASASLVDGTWVEVVGDISSLGIVIDLHHIKQVELSLTQSVTYDQHVGCTYSVWIDNLYAAIGDATTHPYVSTFAFGALAADRTQQATPVVLRAGVDLQEATFQADTRSQANVALIQGANNYIVDIVDPLSTSPDGRRETYISINGTQNDTTLRALGQNNLDIVKMMRVAKTYTLQLNSPSFGPLVDYYVGDYVWIDSTGTLERVRLRQLVLSQADSGLITGTGTFNDKFTELELQLNEKLNSLTSGATLSGGAPAVPVPVNGGDSNVPSQVSGVTYSTLYAVDSNGNGESELTVSWAPVTSHVDGSNLLDLAGYTVTYWYPAFSGTTQTYNTTEVSVSLDQLVPGRVVYFTVQAYNIYSVYSDQGPVYQAVLAIDTTPPPVPSTPTVTGVLGALQVAWNGLGSSGEKMPLDFSLVEVHVSTTTGFAPKLATLRDTITNPRGGTVTLTGLAYGTTYYVRLVSVDKSGNHSTASAQASGTAQQAVESDIAAGQITYSELAFKDFGNVVADGTFSLPATRTRITTDAGTSSAWTIVDRGTGWSNSLFRWALSGAGATSAGTTRRAILTRNAQVLDNQKFLIRYAIDPTSTGSGVVNVGIILTSPTTGATSTIAVASTTVLSGTASGYVVVPVGYGCSNATIYAEMASTVTTGTWLIGEVEVREVIQTAIIDDAAVTNAKIQNLAVNNAKVSSLSVGKLTSSTIYADLLLASRIKTANGGARVELNSGGFYAYAAATATLAATVASTATSMTFTLASGSRAFPPVPFVVKIGNEQIYVPTFNATSGAASGCTRGYQAQVGTLGQAIGSTDTAFTLTPGTYSFPDAPFTLAVDSETMYIGSYDPVFSTASSVTRGYLSTTAASHSNGATATVPGTVATSHAFSSTVKDMTGTNTVTIDNTGTAVFTGTVTGSAIYGSTFATSTTVGQARLVITPASVYQGGSGQQSILFYPDSTAAGNIESNPAFISATYSPLSVSSRASTNISISTGDPGGFNSSLTLLGGIAGDLSPADAAQNTQTILTTASYSLVGPTISGTTPALISTFGGINLVNTYNHGNWSLDVHSGSLSLTGSTSVTVGSFSSSSAGTTIGQSTTVSGILTASGGVTANGGIIANSGITSNGLILANHGISVSSGWIVSATGNGGANLNVFNTDANVAAWRYTGYSGNLANGGAVIDSYSKNHRVYFDWDGSTFYGFIDGTQVFSLPGNFNGSTVSDERLKRDVAVAKTTALRVVMNAPVHTFRYLNDTDDSAPRRGIIAQHLPEWMLLKRAPYGDEPKGLGDVLCIRPNEQVTVLWQAVQELHEELQTLRQSVLEQVVDRGYSKNTSREEQ